MQVYLITNSVNGRVYVGQTIQSLAKRWLQHQNDSGKNIRTRALLNAIKKYGAENFRIESLRYARTLSELTKFEKEFIASFRSFPPSLGFGYNMTPGGYGGGHYEKHTEETKRKVGDKNKGRSCNEETKKLISEKLKGRIITNEHRIKLSIYWKGKTSLIKGKPKSKEHKEKLHFAALRRYAHV